MTIKNGKTIFQIIGIAITILLLCSGWVFGIVKDSNTNVLNELKNELSDLKKIVLQHEKIIPVIEMELKYINKSLEKILNNIY